MWIDDLLSILNYKKYCSTSSICTASKPRRVTRCMRESLANACRGTFRIGVKPTNVCKVTLGIKTSSIKHHKGSLRRVINPIRAVVHYYYTNSRFCFFINHIPKYEGFTRDTNTLSSWDRHTLTQGRCFYTRFDNNRQWKNIYDNMIFSLFPDLEMWVFLLICQWWF